MNYSLLIIGDSKVDGDGGHFPVPAGCRNRDFYPPKFISGGSGAAELFLENCRLL
jgi:hypothetical protein